MINPVEPNRIVQQVKDMLREHPVEEINVVQLRDASGSSHIYATAVERAESRRTVAVVISVA